MNNAENAPILREKTQKSANKAWESGADGATMMNIK
jgi:hypothetical protein